MKNYEQKIYGIYYAEVANTNDPEARGRMRLRIPELLGDQSTDWADVSCFSGGIDAGSMIIPDDYENILAIVQFLQGDIQKPIVMGFINSGSKKHKNLDTPIESILLCDGTKCNVCSDKKIKSDEVYEHKAYHNHINQFYCAKRKVLYKSQKGASIIIDERGGSETLEIIDQAGQILKFNCPIKKDKVGKRGNKTVLDEQPYEQSDLLDAYIEFMDVAGQFIKLAGKLGSEEIRLEGKNINLKSLFNVMIESYTTTFKSNLEIIIEAPEIILKGNVKIDNGVSSIIPSVSGKLNTIIDGIAVNIN